MLRHTLSLQHGNGSYRNRTPQLPINWRNSRWGSVHGAPVSRSPFSNKHPTEWGDTWDRRDGVEWRQRAGRRGVFVGWPWISWRDDPVRQHRKPKSRTFSAQLAASGNVGFPLWDHYAETATEYRLPNTAVTTAALPHVSVYTSASWPHDDIVSFLNQIAADFPTLDVIAHNPDALRTWRSTNRRCTVPPGFIEHVILFSRDLLRHNAKKAYRVELQRRGVLRTNEMARYYALPRVTAGQPVMPDKLEQAEGKEPEGAYTWLLSGANFHPLFAPKNPRRGGFYDA